MYLNKPTKKYKNNNIFPILEVLYEMLEMSTCLPPPINKHYRKHKWKLRMENAETQATLDTRHRAFVYQFVIVLEKQPIRTLYQVNTLF